jgi:hypothetical protein
MAHHIELVKSATQRTVVIKEELCIASSHHPKHVLLYPGISNIQLLKYAIPNAIAMQSDHLSHVCLLRSSDGLASSTRCQHINHTLHTPCYLTGLDGDSDAAHQCIYQAVNLLAPAQLVGIEIQDNQSHVSGQTRGAVVGDVLDQPAQYGLQGHLVAVGEGGAESRAVA